MAVDIDNDRVLSLIQSLYPLTKLNYKFRPITNIGKERFRAGPIFIE
jgi:hypothetical protein